VSGGHARTRHARTHLIHSHTHARATHLRLVSHYPNHYELTRKDLMVKNIKRYLKVRVPICVRGLLGLTHEGLASMWPC
jgi:hypothetical protein